MQSSVGNGNSTNATLNHSKSSFEDLFVVLQVLFLALQSENVVQHFHQALVTGYVIVVKYSYHHLWHLLPLPEVGVI